VVTGGILLIVRRTARGRRGADAPGRSPPAPVPVSGDDEALAMRVEKQLFGGAPPPGVTVESRAGVVTLRGPVADEQAEVRFVRDAEAIEGVKAVQSELQAAGADPGSAPS
jgi:osmotically-inducible protein OsmY